MPVSSRPHYQAAPFRRESEAAVQEAGVCAEMEKGAQPCTIMDDCSVPKSVSPSESLQVLLDSHDAVV